MGMNFEEFTENVKASIRDVLPEKYQDAAVDIGTMEKINTTYTALYVRPGGENYAFALDLDEYYEDYVVGEKSFEEVIRDMSGKIQGNEQASVDMSIFRDYEAAKERLYIRVCGAEQNQDLLESVPHQKVEDMAIIYYLLVFENENGTSSAMVTNNLMQAYGISQEQLHQDAIENSQNLYPMRFSPLREVMSEMFYEEMRVAGIPDDLASRMFGAYQEEAMPAYVLTNDRIINGAGVLFYPGVMDLIGENLGGGYVVLPSSVHEMLVLPDDGRMTAIEMKGMVSDVNGSVVEPEERLTDESYHYDRDAHIFEKFSSFEARTAEMEKSENPRLAAESPVVDKLPEAKPVQGRKVTTAREQQGKSGRKSVLKRLEQKKSEIKAREAGKKKVQGKRKNAALE